jgi:hypothetical protein
MLEARTGQFLSACGKGEMDRVKLMLGQGWDVNAVDYGNRTGLMLAAANGQKVRGVGAGSRRRAAAPPARRPCWPLGTPPLGTPPLSICQAVVDVLLAVNARPNTIDRNGSSALLEVGGSSWLGRGAPGGGWGVPLCSGPAQCGWPPTLHGWPPAPHTLHHPPPPLSRAPHPPQSRPAVPAKTRSSRPSCAAGRSWGWTP